MGNVLTLEGKSHVNSEINFWSCGCTCRNGSPVLGRDDRPGSNVARSHRAVFVTKRPVGVVRGWREHRPPRRMRRHRPSLLWPFRLLAPSLLDQSLGSSDLQLRNPLAQSKRVGAMNVATMATLR